MIDVLKKIPLFENLTDEELTLLSSFIEEKSFEPEERIFTEGDPGDGIYIIQKGRVRISILLPGIGEELLALLRNGSHFGEMAVIEDKPRSASAIADENTKCLFIPKKNFLQFLNQNIEIENKILKGLLQELSSRLRKTDNKLKEILLLIKSF